MKDNKEIFQLNETSLLIDDLESMRIYGFRPSMKLELSSFKLNGLDTIQIKGIKNSLSSGNDSSFSVSDSPKHLFISLNLGDHLESVIPNQDVEVKFQPLKINITVLPVVNIDDEKRILAKGLAAIDFSRSLQQWKKQPVFDGVPVAAFFQNLIQNQYTSNQIAFNMASTFGNARNRVKELQRNKYNLCVMIYTGDDFSIELLEKFLKNQDVFSQVQDGVVVIARDPEDLLFSVKGMITHGRKTVFKILRQKFDKAMYLEAETPHPDAENHYLLSASYLFPYSAEYNQNDSMQEMILKVNDLADRLQQEWRKKNGEGNW